MQQVYIGTTSYGRHWLDAPAAASWFRMVRDGCPPGGITDAGRTQAEQEALFRKHFTTNYAASAKHDRRVWNGQTWWRRPGFPSAATPGSPQARHQWGLSLDLNGATKAWVRANGHRYGWIKDVVRGEDWHMEYQQNRDTVLVSNPGAGVGNVPNVSVPGAPAPIEPKKDEDDEVIVYEYEGQVWREKGLSLRRLTDAAQISVARTTASKVIQVDAYGLAAAKQLVETDIKDVAANLKGQGL